MGDEVAIVTAGGSGMGAAATKRLAADGFQVAILSSSGKGEALAAEVGGFGVTGSNQSTADLERLVDGTMERWGRIDALINSAGHGPRAPILEITNEQWHTGLDMCFLNVVRPTWLVAPIMKAQKGGAIVNISTARVAEPNTDAFAADNVRMNNVLPGWIDSLPATEELRQSVPLGRYGMADEVAGTIAFLVSEGAAYITGQSLRVDGGITRSI